MSDRYASLKQGLVGCWIPSVSGSGLLLPDLSGRGNNGALTNMDASDWVSSGSGRALEFDGVDNRVEAASLADFVTDCCVSIWAWISQSGSGFDAIPFRTTTVFGGATRNGIGFILRDAFLGSPSDTATAEITIGGTRYRATSDTGLARGVWHHLIAQRQSNELSLWINGIKQTTTATYSGTITNESATFIGKTNDYTPSAIVTQLDDIRAYNRALSESEIKLLASRPGIGLRRESHRNTFYQFPSGARRKRILTGLP